jgi:hypothetical protein
VNRCRHVGKRPLFVTGVCADQQRDNLAWTGGKLNFVNARDVEMPPEVLASARKSNPSGTMKLMIQDATVSHRKATMHCHVRFMGLTRIRRAFVIENEHLFV